jgi:hypothetical protein
VQVNFSCVTTDIQIPDFVSMVYVPGLMALSNPTISDTSSLEGWLTVQTFDEMGLKDAFSLLPQGMYVYLCKWSPP